MKRLPYLLLALALSVGLAAAQPRPAYNGDYWTRYESPWYDWIVVSKELAGRLHPGWPSDWAQSGVELRWNVWAWPVVAQFPKGVLLKAAPDVAGQIIIKDENNDSWLRVYRDESEGSVCFVRCNKRFLRPYKTNTPPANLPTLPEPEPEPLPVEPSPSPSP